MSCRMCVPGRRWVWTGGTSVCCILAGACTGCPLGKRGARRSSQGAHPARMSAQAPCTTNSLHLRWARVHTHTHALLHPFDKQGHLKHRKNAFARIAKYACTHARTTHRLEALTVRGLPVGAEPGSQAADVDAAGAAAAAAIDACGIGTLLLMPAPLPLLPLWDGADPCSAAAAAAAARWGGGGTPCTWACTPSTAALARDGCVGGTGPSTPAPTLAAPAAAPADAAACGGGCCCTVGALQGCGGTARVIARVKGTVTVGMGRGVAEEREGGEGGQGGRGRESVVLVAPLSVGAAVPSVGGGSLLRVAWLALCVSWPSGTCVRAYVCTRTSM